MAKAGNKVGNKTGNKTGSKAGNKPGKRLGPYTRRGISDPKKMARVPSPTLDLRKPSGIADAKDADSYGEVMNRKKTINTHGMKYLKG